MDALSGQLQEISNHSLENVLACPKTQQDRKPKPQPEQALECPRCESTNTKFCYYNNYSLSQPRYFCKSCRRYWTKGGTLRNVPVGGGCRKNKRSSSSSLQKRNQDYQSLGNNPNNPLAGFPTLGSYDSNDLALAFARLQQKQFHGQQQGYEDHNMSIMGHQNSTQCDILGHHNENSGFALRSGTYLDNHNGFQNLDNYGVGNAGHNLGDVDSSTGGSVELVPYHEEIISQAATSTAETVTRMKQEMCNVARESENRVLWGFPWQFNGDGNMGDFAAASSWHGLINSPLM